MKNVTVSLAEKLGRAHAALLNDLQKLEEMANDPGVVPHDVQAELAAVQKHIAEHFRFEEQNGYMNAVRKREPQRERTVEKLREEHRELSRSLNELVGDADPAKGTVFLQARIRSWIEQVRGHEGRENRLVQEVFNRDTWAED